MRSNITLVRPGQTIKEERWSYLWGTIWEEDAKICESVVWGVELRHALDETLRSIEEVFARHLVLYFPEQSFDRFQLRELSGPSRRAS